MKVFSATDIGQKRTMNQDFVFASASPVGNLPNLFVVADGMGGHNAGDFASRYGVSVLVESVKRDTNFNPVRIIRHGIEAANSQIFEQRYIHGRHGYDDGSSYGCRQLCLRCKRRRQQAVSGSRWHV